MLAIQHLSVEYFRRGTLVPALRDVSLTISAGETLGLVGESGSGKSTLALAVMRLIGPQEGRITAGQIEFKGQNLLALSNESMRKICGKQIAMIFQDPFTALNPVMRISEQMQEVLQAHAEAGTSQRLEEALDRVQLDPRRILPAYPHQLSGGQRQRILIATALLGRPELVLADEPTTALDVLVQREILDLLFNLQKQLHIGMLFISHNLGLVAQYAQRIAVMQAGQIVEESASQGLFQHPQHPYTQSLLNAFRRLSPKQ
jgi:ABC-type dipeptide/oligopeptide/nickel transport system ATPase component